MAEFFTDVLFSQTTFFSKCLLPTLKYWHCTLYTYFFLLNHKRSGGREGEWETDVLGVTGSNPTPSTTFIFNIYFEDLFWKFAKK